MKIAILTADLGQTFKQMMSNTQFSISETVIITLVILAVVPLIEYIFSKRPIGLSYWLEYLILLGVNHWLVEKLPNTEPIIITVVIILMDIVIHIMIGNGRSQ